MPIDYEKIKRDNIIPMELITMPRDETYNTVREVEERQKLDQSYMDYRIYLELHPEKVGEMVAKIELDLLHDLGIIYSRYYDPNNTALYEKLVKDRQELARQDMESIPGYDTWKSSRLVTIGPASTSNYQISDDEVKRNYNLVNFARNSAFNIGSGAYNMPVDYRNSEAVRAYVDNAGVQANFVNDALATAGVGYLATSTPLISRGINTLGTWTAKGILNAGRLITPSEYLPGLNYYGRMIFPRFNIPTSVGRWADALAFSGMSAYATQNAINNPTPENITYAGLSYLPVVSGVKNIFTSIPNEYYLSYFRHPTWKTYYHASNNPFNPNEFLVKANDLGMHVNDDIRAARTFGRKYIYKMRAPRPSAETIDIWGNDWRLLSTDYPYATHPRMFKHNFITSTKDDFLRYQMIDEAGGMPSWNLYNTGIHNERPVELNLRSRFPKVDLKQADFVVMSGENLLKLYPDPCPGAHSLDYNLYAPRINEMAANVLSNAGYNTVKYVNIGEVNKYTPYSYFITNPSMVDVLPKILWNTNNAFSNGYFNIPFMLRYSNNNEQNNK